MIKPILLFIGILFLAFLMTVGFVVNSKIAFLVLMSFICIAILLVLWGLCMALFDREFDGKKIYPDE